MSTTMSTTIADTKIMSFSVEDYSSEILSMTIGHHGKNFIKWTETTPGIDRIWHNKESNEIEITGQDSNYLKVKEIIQKVLHFNQSIVNERTK